MDTDSGPSIRPGGTVEPANRAAVAKERFQTPRPVAAERFELRDPFAEVTYRANGFDEMVAKADQLQASKFYAVDAEDKRTPINKIGGVWQRERTAERSAPTSIPTIATPLTQVRALGSTVQATSEPVIAKVDLEAEKTARVARLEIALTERYVIKRAAIKIGDVPLGQTEYRYRGDANRIAFTESTFRLSTDNNNPSVARSMVDVAEARNWQGIRVSGHEDFKRLVWLEASIRGVRALGYEPQAGDQELLQREREARSVNRIEPAQVAQGDSADSSKSKQSARGSGGRKAVLAALEAVLIAKNVPERQREAVMTAAAENLAERLRQGQTLRVKVYDKAAPQQRPVEQTKPERQVTREPVVHVR
ncbi:MAG: LPD7 domain-containing protein [Caldimonas sp.]